MSNQPKPATGEQEFGQQIFCWKCGRPYHTADRECPNCGGRNLTPDLCAKPTGEWTEDSVREMRFDAQYEDQFIADAHNAALAAERGKVAAIQAGMKSLIKKWLTKTPSTWDSAYINTWNECASDLENAFMDTK